MDVPAVISAEFDAARAARADGNEGRARVHARRAAGAAAQLYRSVYFPSGPRLNGFRHLQHIARDINLSEDIRNAAARLMARVKPDHTLPHDEDPLEDAAFVVRELLARLSAGD